MRLKLLCCCGAGMGTCMLLKNKVDSVVSELGWRAKIDCESVTIGKTTFENYDAVFTNHNLVDNFEVKGDAKVAIIGLENVMSTAEIKEKLTSNSTIAAKANS